jgi:hypothetical protein
MTTRNRKSKGPKVVKCSAWPRCACIMQGTISDIGECGSHPTRAKKPRRKAAR